MHSMVDLSFVELEGAQIKVSQTSKDWSYCQRPLLQVQTVIL